MVLNIEIGQSNYVLKNKQNKYTYQINLYFLLTSLNRKCQLQKLKLNVILANVFHLVIIMTHFPKTSEFWIGNALREQNK